MSCGTCSGCDCSGCVVVPWKAFPDFYSVELSLPVKVGNLWYFGNPFGNNAVDDFDIVCFLSGTFILARQPQSAQDPNTVIYTYKQTSPSGLTCSPSPPPVICGPAAAAACANPTFEESITITINTCNFIGLSESFLLRAKSANNFIDCTGAPQHLGYNVRWGGGCGIGWYTPLAVKIDPTQPIVMFNGSIYQISAPGFGLLQGAKAGSNSITITPV